MPKSVSLVIPIRNEASSVVALIDSIRVQTILPDEVVLIDGGSTDETVEIVESMINAPSPRTDAMELPSIRLIKTDGASPGRGRNIGIHAARNEWIALTDAGIRLEPDWLENLIEVANRNPRVDLVYGFVDTVIETVFDKCATLAYVLPPDSNGIRRSIASSLIRKSVWQGVGGFPDLRASEDLIFMDAVERNYTVGYAPAAAVHWQLRPNLISTFQKFVLYSKFNVWAGRQRYWHYGILRQYLLMFAIVVPATFFVKWAILLVLPWFASRAVKRILLYKSQFGYQPLIEAKVLLGIMVIIITIDIATFTGWIHAILTNNSLPATDSTTRHGHSL
jgi:glycosyltransferase involved in cell wall biosynthesis